MLLFNFFPQVFLLWHQLIIHRQDSSAVFLMLFIFVPDMFGVWGAGKEAGAIAPLLPSDSIFLYRLEPCCRTTSCFGIRDHSSLPIMRWTASQAPPLMTQHSHRHPVSHDSRCYKSRKLRDLRFFLTISCVLSFIQTALLCIYTLFWLCSHPVFFTFIILLLWLLWMTIISHLNSDSFSYWWVGLPEIENQLLCQDWEIFDNVEGFHWQAWVLLFVILGFLLHGSHARFECLMTGYLLSGLGSNKSSLSPPLSVLLRFEHNHI